MLVVASAPPQIIKYYILIEAPVPGTKEFRDHWPRLSSMFSSRSFLFSVLEDGIFLEVNPFFFQPVEFVSI